MGTSAGREEELLTDSEHQPIVRSRVDKCSAYFKSRYSLKIYSLKFLGFSEQDINQDIKPAKLGSVFLCYMYNRPLLLEESYSHSNLLSGSGLAVTRLLAVVFGFEKVALPQRVAQK